ncbi:hypothetical protein [Microcoleus sp. N3A4]
MACGRGSVLAIAPRCHNFFRVCRPHSHVNAKLTSSPTLNRLNAATA